MFEIGTKGVVFEYFFQTFFLGYSSSAVQKADGKADGVAIKLTVSDAADIVIYQPT
jgi:hypothetical protein